MRMRVNWLGVLAPSAAGLLLLAAVAIAADPPPQPAPSNGQSQPAPPQDSTTPPHSEAKPDAKDETQGDPNEKICKVEQMTGTRVGRKVCKTRKEWEEAAKGGGGDF